MIPRILLLLLLSCCAALQSNAQVLEGITADADGASIPGVVIINKTRNQSAISNAEGKYTITAFKGDHIEFSFLGYYPLDIIMPEAGNVFRRISMRKQLLALDEVEIRPDLSPYQQDSLERRSRYASDLNRTRASSSVLGAVFHPASALAEQFNKKSKQRYRFQQNFAKWEGQKFIDSRYTPDQVAALTGLGGDSLASFINTYPMSYDYARTATDMEIKMWIKYNYRQWMKNPVLLPSVTDNMNIAADSARKP